MYYFRLHKIYDDGSMKIHTEQVSSIEDGTRDLGNGIHDLPGGNCIWHGYVEATTPDEAKTKVAASY